MYISEVQSGQKLRKRRFISPYLGEILRGNIAGLTDQPREKALSTAPTTAPFPTPSPASQSPNGSGAQLIQGALRRGVRDENQLTNLVFFARHPERRGQRLQPHERRLVQEWLDIRNRLTRPTLAQPLPTQPVPTGGSLVQLATGILNNPRITLAAIHVSRVNDNATARQNIIDTSNGLPAARSNYGNAPGGAVQLDTRLLEGILRLAERFSFAISEIAGGSHSRTSRHYAGIAMDVNVINGQRVSARHPDVRGFMRACRDLGATEVLGPGDPDHDTHIHCAWPRR